MSRRLDARLADTGVVDRALAALFVLSGLAALAIAIAGSAHRRPRDVALAIAAASLGTVCVRRFGLAALLVVPFVIGPLWPGTAQPSTGDEPHYLVIAQSVVADHDLAVANNYEKPPFLGLAPHLGWDHRVNHRAVYSIHQPGTGILVSPGWWIDKRRGALMIVAIAAALLLSEMVRLGEAFGASRRTAVVAAAAVYLSPAVFDYGRVVFSEMFVAVCLVHLARCARAVTRPDRSAGGLSTRLTVSACIVAAALPWIHLRYLVPAGLLTLVIAWRGTGVRRWAPVGAMVASYVGVALAFESWFGSPWPSAGYGPAYAGYDHEGHPTGRALIGLLVDNHVGVLFAAPLVVLALAALPALFRRDRIWTAAIGVAVVVYYLIAAGWSGWWLGTATPGRNWTPIAPLAVPLVVIGLRVLNRKLAAVLLALAVAFATLYLAFPLSAYPLANGVTQMWERLHVARVMPGFRNGEGHTSLAVGVVLILVVAGLLVVLARPLSSKAKAH
jgi:hypothetical protein